MIPFFRVTQFNIGPIPIQVWGLMVATGLLVGTWMAKRLAKRRGQDTDLFWDLLFWAMVGALIGARLFHVFLYEPGFYLGNPLEIIKVWHGGWSSVGGFIGGALAGIWFLRRCRVDVWAYADTAVFGIPIGLFFGRIGCFLIHDHPGTVTDFPLGVQYPDGIIRHDLGLYLALNALVLWAIFFWLSRRGAKIGTYIMTFLIYYGATRFFLDFLRATEGPIVDMRYLGLTPAQYVAVLMAVGGMWLFKDQKLKVIEGKTKL